MQNESTVPLSTNEFKQLIEHKGTQLYRAMPWREDTRPYYVLVSELMLQQTQVARVIPKFTAFIETFPDEASLAAASLAEVLRLWQGLGYNRRAKFLHESAKVIMQKHNGIFPTEEKNLLALPGVGKNTAGAIQAYAFNRAVIFVETNIRTVYTHHFFSQLQTVSDVLIVEKLSQTIDHEQARTFYWALMDYGSWLKGQGVKLNAKSSHYTKQPKLEGSIRQMRGSIIAALVAHASMTHDQLLSQHKNDKRFEPALQGLLKDGLITLQDRNIHLTK